VCVGVCVLMLSCMYFHMCL